MSILSEIEPKRVFYYFEEISGIPHGSGNVQKISDYCVGFAEKNGLEYYRDESGNVIIYKNAYPGYEESEAVILQGHIDMVCEKEDGCDIDFEKDGLKLAVEDGYLFAEGTTLGADDGVAVCFMLALLENKYIKAPALQCVFTVDEEIGMLGAAELDMSKISARRMINLDNGEEGSMLIGCAGGVTATCHLPVNSAEISGRRAIIEISGLAGGHSGEMIIEERASANVLMGRTLFELSKIASINVISVNGGLKDNAISRSSKAEIVIKNNIEAVKDAISILEKIYKKEYAATDSSLELNISIGEVCNREKAYDNDSTKRLIAVLFNLPNGIQKMSKKVPGLVQSSLNMGILKSDAEEVTFSFSVRSDYKTEKEEMCRRMEALLNLAGGNVTYCGDYPAWEVKDESSLQKIMLECYEEYFGMSPKIGTIHAGLECGIFSDALAGLDCVSIGPTMKDIHTSAETLDIKSTERYWEYLLTVLERLK